MHEENSKNRAIYTLLHNRGRDTLEVSTVTITCEDCCKGVFSFHQCRCLCKGLEDCSNLRLWCDLNQHVLTIVGRHE